MTLRLRLYFHYRKYSPGGEPSFEMDLPPGSLVEHALENLGLPLEPHMILLLNGKQADPKKAILHGDELVVFPPVDGG